MKFRFCQNSFAHGAWSKGHSVKWINQTPVLAVHLKKVSRQAAKNAKRECLGFKNKLKEIFAAWRPGVSKGKIWKLNSLLMAKKLN